MVEAVACIQDGAVGPVERDETRTDLAEGWL